jgi:hypothetical protein
MLAVDANREGGHFMAGPKAMRHAVKAMIRELLDEGLENVLVKNPFSADWYGAEWPWYTALVPDEVFKGAHFERRFVMPLGSVWERLAVMVASQSLGYGVAGYSITGVIKIERLRRIARVLNSLERPATGKARVKPDWESELTFVLEGKGREIPVTVVCDVYVEDRKRGKRLAFELKASSPSSDITKVSKEKLLKLYSMEPRQVDEAYYALPYNPYERRADYARSFPTRWFNMRHDEVVLIGNEFWEKIGGLGIYQAFIDAVNEIGPKYKERIYREFLGIEPPARLWQSKL